MEDFCNIILQDSPPSDPSSRFQPNPIHHLPPSLFQQIAPHSIPITSRVCYRQLYRGSTEISSCPPPLPHRFGAGPSRAAGGRKLCRCKSRSVNEQFCATSGRGQLYMHAMNRWNPGPRRHVLSTKGPSLVSRGAQHFAFSHLTQDIRGAYRRGIGAGNTAIPDCPTRGNQFWLLE